MVYASNDYSIVYSAIKKNEVLIDARRYMNLENVILQRKQPVTNDRTLHGSIYMKPTISKSINTESRLVVSSRLWGKWGLTTNGMKN